jgi:hypothetical protein
LPWDHCSKKFPSLHIGTIAHPQQYFLTHWQHSKKEQMHVVHVMHLAWKNNHIAFTHNNPNLSLQLFNVTNEQKTWTWMAMKSWHSVKVVQKISSISYLRLLLVNQEKKLKCVFGCILNFTWQYYC